MPSRIVVVGLGYVGLPLAAAFGKVLPTTGFDIDQRRIQQLRDGHDRNGDVRAEDLTDSQVCFTDDPSCLEGAPFVVVAVPTPVDRAKRPDLTALKQASEMVGRCLRRVQNGPVPIITYESTVYPGCTQEVCAPILEAASGLQCGVDFKVAYSPERLNPGDPDHSLDRVVKVVSGQDEETLERVALVYEQVVSAGVYRAPDIPTAEAAKAIENVQRDLNIALMNELAMLFHRMGISPREVLKAGQTKWNFLPFQPGLVGGHCIPVDPYYVTHKAEELGFHPQLILAGRRTNDSMGLYVAQETVKLLIKTGRVVQGSPVLVLGATFKENVPDLRNSRVLELVNELTSYGCAVFVHDPYIDDDALKGLGLKVVGDPFVANERYDAVVLAVAHRPFLTQSPEAYLRLLGDGARPGVLVDVKGVLPQEARQASGVAYWSL